jgi:hypothetical protein
VLLLDFSPKVLSVWCPFRHSAKFLDDLKKSGLVGAQGLSPRNLKRVESEHEARLFVRPTLEILRSYLMTCRRCSLVARFVVQPAGIPQQIRNIPFISLAPLEQDRARTPERLAANSASSRHRPRNELLNACRCCHDFAR